MSEIELRANVQNARSNPLAQPKPIPPQKAMHQNNKVTNTFIRPSHATVAPRAIVFIFGHVYRTACFVQTKSPEVVFGL